jgi:methylenetetrahydrofolate dehydrogenase (NADP+)/methenyltetrahydrofolate cyclohydrolase
MPATLLDGKKIAAELRGETAKAIAAHRAAGRRAPGLAVVLAGENPASQVYVRNKIKACREIGIQSIEQYLPAEVAPSAVVELVKELNERKEVDGILIQMPLPKGHSADALLDLLDPVKDVDGFTAVNTGRLQQGRPGHEACTPAGIIELLHRYKLQLSGMNAVVVGRSNIVGKPMALLLLRENATVTVAHSHSRDLPELCRKADLVVAAIGRPAFLGSDCFAPGAIVVDVGMNRVESSLLVEQWFPGDAKRKAEFDKNGAILVGDVDPRAYPALSAYTPVPGGVGPLTIAQLMRNTLAAYEHREEIKPLF